MLKEVHGWKCLLPYVLVQSEVPLTVSSEAIWRNICVLPKRRTSISKDGFFDAMLLICEFTVKWERRWRFENRFLSFHTTIGSVDASEFWEFCLSTAEWQTPKVKKTRKGKLCREKIQIVSLMFSCRPIQCFHADKLFGAAESKLSYFPSQNQARVWTAAQFTATMHLPIYKLLL